jgi:hypothetical protein
MCNWSVGVVSVLITAILGCTSPFSDLQTGRVLEKGQTEMTPFYSAVSFGNEGESTRIQTSYGMIVGIGLDEERRSDLRMRYERISLEGDDDEINVVGLGPKFRIAPDDVALLLPVGFAFGDGVKTSKTWETQPTILMTGSPASWLEVTGSVKALIRLNSEGSDPRIAFNLGAGLGPDPRRLALHPEVGFMINPGADGYYYHLSLGFSVGWGESSVTAGGQRTASGEFAYSHVDFREKQGFVEVSGEIVNQTGLSYVSANFVVLCYDSLGRVVTKDHVTFSSFKNGQTRSFKTLVIGAEFSEIAVCRIRFEGGFEESN